MEITMKKLLLVLPLILIFGACEHTGHADVSERECWEVDRDSREGWHSENTYECNREHTHEGWSRHNFGMPTTLFGQSL